MRVFINPGHDLERDSGAVNPTSGLRECDVAANIGGLVKGYLEAAGCEVQMLQSDNLAGETPGLPCVVDTANGWSADVLFRCIAMQRMAMPGEPKRWSTTRMAMQQNWPPASNRKSLVALAPLTAASRNAPC